jgi:hypothetical protein
VDREKRRPLMDLIIMKEALKLILEAMTYRVQQEKASEAKSIDSFVSHTKAKNIARERMIKATEEL